MVTFIISLMLILTGVILLGLGYLCKKKVSKITYDKFDLKWCSKLGFLSLANGVFGITNSTNLSEMSEFIYLYYLYIILNIVFLTIVSIFVYRALKLLINNFNKNIRR